MDRRVDLNDVHLLLQVVKYGSFSAAGREIGLPKSTISHRIAQLETAVGVGLLQRSSRALSLTEAGNLLLPHSQAIDELSRQIEATVSNHGGTLQGQLKVNCSRAVAQYALAPLVPKFLDLHPGITIRIDAENRYVDMMADGYDVTIRGHIEPLKDSALIRRSVCHTRWLLAASPAWIERNGLPNTPADLRNAETLCFSGQPDCKLISLHRDNEKKRIKVNPRLIMDDMLALITSATEDLGVVYLPGYILFKSIASGVLIELLPDWRGQIAMLSVLTPPKSQSSRLASAFATFLAEEMPALVEPGREGSPTSR